MTTVRKRHQVAEQPTESNRTNRFRTLERAIKQADVFQKVESEHETQTNVGGLLSFASFVLIAWLFLSELRLYLNPATSDHIIVDTTRQNDLPIEFDITFPALRCSEVHIDVMDVSGRVRCKQPEGACCTPTNHS